MPARKKFKTVPLTRYLNWPKRTPKDQFLKTIAQRIRGYAKGRHTAWGIPFYSPKGKGPATILTTKHSAEVTFPVGATADYLCFEHEWLPMPCDSNPKIPTEGLVVAEYTVTYASGSTHVIPVRTRFEVMCNDSKGPLWNGKQVFMREAIDPMNVPEGQKWGYGQSGLDEQWLSPLLCALKNPHPRRKIKSVTIRCFTESPFVVAAMTLFSGEAHPLAHMPRRTYRVRGKKGLVKVKKAEIDLGLITRIVATPGPRGKAWLTGNHAGIHSPVEPTRDGEDLVELSGAKDATLSVTVDGRKKPAKFNIREAFEDGSAKSGDLKLEVLGKTRQWMQVSVTDKSTGQLTPTRIHFSNARGQYIAPYGHHDEINTNWFEDYGADVVAGGRNYAYVPGKFTTDMPTGDLYVEINKGFEYAPVRKKIVIKPGQKKLNLSIDRWTDLRKDGWVTADTHVHFISPHTAWLEAQAEGVNVVNLLATQWGRLFTNVGDITGKPGVVENDTIVYVGTENRNHMLGHMSMLGTKGDEPVYPMCCGGPGESWIGDPEFRSLAEWALENKRKGGVVIRPHFPYCGNGEDPVPIVKGLVDALEVNMTTDALFPMQEWYRYLNCGYRVAVCGGTDKMGAYNPVGWQRTYALLDPNRKFTYDSWAEAVRSGRTTSTTGPMIDMSVDGKMIGDSIQMGTNGGTVQIIASAQSFWPLGVIEIIYNGKVVAKETAPKGAQHLAINTKIRIPGSGWIAARCSGKKRHAAHNLMAHTSPVYVKCGKTRAFDGPAAEHMLALVEGSIEYMNTLATIFDESSRKRIVKLFGEVKQELKGRLVVEAQHSHHHGNGHYHTHGHGADAGHQH